MSVTSDGYQANINLQPANAAQLVPMAFAGFAHFTAMQVRNRKVKGLDLHLARLRNASNKLFGIALPDSLVQSYIRQAIESGPHDQSLTVTVFARDGEFTAASMDVAPDVLVRTGPPSDGPSGPLRLSVIEYERPLPQVKHVGEVGKTYYLHKAIRQGFNDAAFIDRQGRLSEASIWNLVFWDGKSVIWPEAAMLTGTMMGIVQRQLDRLGIAQRKEQITLARLNDFSGAAVMNSWTPAIAVTAIGQNRLAHSRPFIELLHRAYESEPANFL